MKLKMLMLIQEEKLFHHLQIHQLKIQTKLTMLFLVGIS